MLRAFAKAFLAILLLAAIAWGIAATQILRFAQQSASGTADAALVLGAAAWGNRPSPVYRERIANAVLLYTQGRVHWIVLTGGSPLPGYPSEAQVGRRYCLQQGVPDSALVLEDRSRTTWGNLRGAQAEMKRRGIRSVLLVSDPLHMKRATAMARAQGMDAQPSPTQTSRFRSWDTRALLLWHETWLYLGFELFGVRD